MKRVWIYGRDSLSDSDLASQIEGITQYARDNQIEVIGSSSDLSSGHDLDRDGLRKAIQAVKDKKVDSILISDLDRITSDVKLMKEFAQAVEDPAVLSIVDEKDAAAWEEIRDALLQKKPLQSDLGLLFSGLM